MLTFKYEKPEIKLLNFLRLFLLYTGKMILVVAQLFCLRLMTLDVITECLDNKPHSNYTFLVLNLYPCITSPSLKQKASFLIRLHAAMLSLEPSLEPFLTFDTIGISDSHSILFFLWLRPLPHKIHSIISVQR